MIATTGIEAGTSLRNWLGPGRAEEVTAMQEPVFHSAARRLRGGLLGIAFVAGGLTLGAIFAPAASAEEQDRALDSVLDTVVSVVDTIERPLVHTVDRVVVTVDATVVAADTAVFRTPVTPPPVPAALQAPPAAVPAPAPSESPASPAVASTITQPLTGAVAQLAAERPLSLITGTATQTVQLTVAQLPLLDSLLNPPLGAILPPVPDRGVGGLIPTLGAAPTLAASPAPLLAPASAASDVTFRAPGTAQAPAAPLELASMLSERAAQEGDPGGEGRRGAPQGSESTPAGTNGSGSTPLAAVTGGAAIISPLTAGISSTLDDDAVPSAPVFDTDASPD